MSGCFQPEAVRGHSNATSTMTPIFLNCCTARASCQTMPKLSHRSFWMCSIVAVLSVALTCCHCDHGVHGSDAQITRRKPMHTAPATLTTTA